MIRNTLGCPINLTEKDQVAKEPRELRVFHRMATIILIYLQSFTSIYALLEYGKSVRQKDSESVFPIYTTTIEYNTMAAETVGRVK